MTECTVETKPVVVAVPYADEADRAARLLLLWVDAESEAKAIAAFERVRDRQPADLLKLMGVDGDEDDPDAPFESFGVLIGDPVALHGVPIDVAVPLPELKTALTDPEILLDCAACRRHLLLTSTGDFFDSDSGRRVDVFDVATIRRFLPLLCARCGKRARHVADAGLPVEINSLTAALQVFESESKPVYDAFESVDAREKERFLRHYRNYPPDPELMKHVTAKFAANWNSGE